MSQEKKFSFLSFSRLKIQSWKLLWSQELVEKEFGHLKSVTGMHKTMERYAAAAAAAGYVFFGLVDRWVLKSKISFFTPLIRSLWQWELFSCHPKCQNIFVPCLLNEMEKKTNFYLLFARFLKRQFVHCLSASSISKIVSSQKSLKSRHFSQKIVNNVTSQELE